MIQRNTAAETYVKAKLYSEKYSEYEEKARESLKNTYLDDDGNLKTGKTQEDYDKAVAKKADTDTVSYISSQLKEDDVKLQIEEAAFSGKTEADMADFSEKAVSKYYSSGVKAFTGMDGVDEDSEKTRMAAYTEKYASVTDRNEALSSSALTSLGLADISVDADGKATVNGGANDSTNTSIPTGMALIEGSDSKIILNGAELTSSSSVVSANGLEISLTGVTKENESVTFSVTTDTDAIYDSVKSFLKEYNSVMKEMNTLYNADSAKGYEPLTSQEKEAMSDDEVKEWETKIKNSLLRSDSTLGSIINAMRSAMQTTVEYDGGTYALSSLGIMTSTDYTEGGLLHIYGDPDDSVYSAKDDKLKKALEENPDVVDEEELRSLLQPTRLYHDVVADMRRFNVTPKAYAHITGGGLPENLERFLGDYGADLSIPYWDNTAAQKILKHVDPQDRFNTFNMGIGWVAIVRPEDAEAALKAGPGGTVIGTLREGRGIHVKVQGE